MVTTVAIATLVPASETVAVVLALAVGLVLLCARRRLQGTTLVGPWCWALLALAAVAAVPGVIAVTGQEDASWHAPLRFAAAATTLCPMMAVLGARRPQQRAWQFVVLSLWLILVLPALETFLLAPGQSLQIHPARSWFLAGLIVLGAVNLLGTRFWLSGLLVAAGQVALFAGELPATSRSLGNDGAALALASWLAALLVAIASPRRGRASQRPLDRLWLDFRDMFGGLWALRVAERMNAAATQYDWKIHLKWGGFHSEGAAEPWPPDVEQALQQTLKNLLRRFVDAPWIANRLEQPLQ